MPKGKADRISLYPLTFEQAVQALVQDKPKQKGSEAEASGSTKEAAPESGTSKRRTSRRQSSSATT